MFYVNRITLIKDEIKINEKYFRPSLFNFPDYNIIWYRLIHAVVKNNYYWTLSGERSYW
jgi:hypothetical protein